MFKETKERWLSVICDMWYEEKIVIWGTWRERNTTKIELQTPIAKGQNEVLFLPTAVVSLLEEGQGYSSVELNVFNPEDWDLVTPRKPVSLLSYGKHQWCMCFSCSTSTISLFPFLVQYAGSSGKSLIYFFSGVHWSSSMSRGPVSCSKCIYSDKNTGIKHVFMLPSFHRLKSL